MGNTALLTKYELVIIIDAKLSSEEKDSVYKEVAEMIKKSGGKIINSQVWLEKHRFSFTIKKLDEGTYYLINFEGDSSVNGKLYPLFKLNEKILRFIIYQNG